MRWCWYWTRDPSTTRETIQLYILEVDRHVRLLQTPWLFSKRVCVFSKCLSGQCSTVPEEYFCHTAVVHYLHHNARLNILSFFTFPKKWSLRKRGHKNIRKTYLRQSQPIEKFIPANLPFHLRKFSGMNDRAPPQLKFGFQAHSGYITKGRNRQAPFQKSPFIQTVVNMFRPVNAYPQIPTHKRV